jgi:Transglutaminase-like superfamily
VGSLFRLSKWELLLLLKAAITVAAVRLALWLVPYDKIRAYLKKPQPVSNHPQSAASVVRFVNAASRVIPLATCLTRAVAAELLLRRNGHDASLQIGVSKTTSNNLLAHAWVESGGVIVIGGDEAEGLTQLRPSVTRRPS